MMPCRRYTALRLTHGMADGLRGEESHARAARPHTETRAAGLRVTGLQGV